MVTEVDDDDEQADDFKMAIRIALEGLLYRARAWEVPGVGWR